MPRMKRIAFVALGIVLLAASALYAAEIDRAKFEGLLIPVPIVPEFAPLPGANGSRWTSQLAMRNGGAADAVVFSGEDAKCLLIICEPPAPPPPSIKPNGFQLGSGGSPGSILYVQKDQADFFAYSLRVRDLSRTTENEGTEIPVVREAELRSRPIHLLNVPINTHSRAALRLFETSVASGVTPTANVTATLTLVPALRFTTRVELTRHQSFNDFVTKPGYFAIDDLRTALGLPADAPLGYDIEVEPLNYTGWAYIAVTNNQTQLVTAIAPK
jgi:hypothetical protein